MTTVVESKLLLKVNNVKHRDKKTPNYLLHWRRERLRFKRATGGAGAGGVGLASGMIPEVSQLHSDRHVDPIDVMSVTVELGDFGGFRGAELRNRHVNLGSTISKIEQDSSDGEDCRKKPRAKGKAKPKKNPTTKKRVRKNNLREKLRKIKQLSQSDKLPREKLRKLLNLGEFSTLQGYDSQSESPDSDWDNAGSRAYEHPDKTELRLCGELTRKQKAKAALFLPDAGEDYTLTEISAALGAAVVLDKSQGLGTALGGKGCEDLRFLDDEPGSPLERGKASFPLRLFPDDSVNNIRMSREPTRQLLVLAKCAQNIKNDCCTT